MLERGMTLRVVGAAKGAARARRNSTLLLALLREPPQWQLPSVVSLFLDAAGEQLQPLERLFLLLGGLSQFVCGISMRPKTGAGMTP